MVHTPVCNNLDFPSGVSDTCFQQWAQWALKGLSNLKKKNIFDNVPIWLSVRFTEQKAKVVWVSLEKGT